MNLVNRTSSPRVLLGGLSAQQFMKRHWQRRPLLVRQAWPGVEPPVSRPALFELCAQEDVESRCIEQGRDGGWRLRHGPLQRRQLPPLSRVGWTLLVQGLDLHSDAAHSMMKAFDFIPRVRLDDLMLSWASDGGGVGPHLDSYDVFLLQVHGQRRWRVGPPGDTRLVPGLPLRILANFEPQEEWLLEPGDMLYLPPGWGHEGVAVGGDCMTASIGFRAPTAGELANALLQRLADEIEDGGAAWPRRRFADRGRLAAEKLGEFPADLQRFARDGLARALADPEAGARALGGWLTEPKPQVWFPPGREGLEAGHGVCVDRRSRMAYDQLHLFINGEAYRVGGLDGRLLRRLTDEQTLDSRACARLSPQARLALEEWLALGWLRPYPC
ncbi:MAG: JmjC domain-containing protein [Burkholderiaceae bacterium]